MSITLSGTTVTFNDATTQTTAGRTTTYVPPVDIQTWTASQNDSVQAGGTWTKPTAGQTMAQIELWGGGGGGTGNVGGCGGGYTMFHVPLAQLPSTLTTNAIGNVGSTNNASGGTAASITAFAAQSGWMGTTQGYLNASGGSGGSVGSGYVFGGPLRGAGGGNTGNSGGYPWGGTGGNSTGNSPGGGSGTNNGNGGTRGGAPQVRITCW